MAAGLSPESWLLLALCGMLLSLLTALLRIEPGLILMPLLTLILPGIGVSAQIAVHAATATATALLIPLSIARLGSLHWDERHRLLRLAPAVFAGAFFGASLLPSMPAPLLLSGFAILAAIALLRRRRPFPISLVIEPPASGTGPFFAILKSVLSALFGTLLPLLEGRRPEKAALTLVLAMGAMAPLLLTPPACKGCVGLIFMPGLVAIAAGAVLKMPLLAVLFKEGRPLLRPVILLALVIALLAVPIASQGPGETALATFVPGLCPVKPHPLVPAVAAYRDPFPTLAARFGPRRGLAAAKAGRPATKAFLIVARDIAAEPQMMSPPTWTASIEIAAPPKPAKRYGKQTSSLSKF